MTAIIVQGACPHDCPDTCGITTEVEDGRAVAIYGQRNHEITQGWLCGKVRPYLEHVYHPERLMYPLRRLGPKGSGRWQRITWEEAAAEISDQWKGIVENYGAEAILPYSYSGTLGLVQMTVSSARFWNRLGASQLQRSICGAAAERAVEATLGVRWSQPYGTVINSKLIIIWGHNPASTAPHFMPFLRKAQRSGARLIVIDPVRTRTAKGADWHLAPMPGTDGALAMSIAHDILEEELHDESWLDTNAIGWSSFRQRLADYPPERVSAITGLSREDIVTLARMYATTKPGLIKTADGINRNRNGGQTVRAICALPALTGQYGVKGGGLSYSSSGFIRWDDETIHKWQECPAPGRWINMNRLGVALLGEASDPPIMSLFVFGANPAASAPNSGRVIQGLLREDLFTVVHELYMTDTADYADIVLPATSQLEQVDLHRAYGHTKLTYNKQAISPLGECKSNWGVMALLADAMGFSEPWLHQSPDEVIEEVLQASAARSAILEGITLDRLKREGTLLPNGGDSIPFEDGDNQPATKRFPTPSGKVELFSSALAIEGLDPLPGWVPADNDPIDPDGSTPLKQAEGTLCLISAAAHHFTSTTFANRSRFLKIEGHPVVHIHPTDALERGIQNGDKVIVENSRGWVELRAIITDGIRPGVLASPKGRWNRLSGGRNINQTTSDSLGDMEGQSIFQSNRVWLRLAK
ncbi:MAG: molybdopterin-dependent oxidoreductase [Candidatus Promineifilaceae bacterium]